jgi:diguanylate cyclase (GGDEF)-like protein
MMMDHVYKGILNSLDNYIVVVDVDGKIAFTNKAWNKLTQCLGVIESFDWQNKNYFDCAVMLQQENTDFVEQCENQIAQLAKGEKEAFVIECEKSTLESDVWLSLSGTIVRLDHKQYIVLSHTNVMDRKQDLEKIEKLTLVDNVTGLANAKKFNSFYNNEWKRSMRSQTEVALLIAELDVNDVNGEQRTSVAKVFSSHARRACDFAGVLNENQFALVLGQVTPNACDAAAQSISEEVASLNLLSESGQVINIHIGVSSSTPTLIDPPETLFNAVGLALQKSKELHQERVINYCPTIKLTEALVLKRH